MIKKYKLGLFVLIVVVSFSMGSNAYAQALSWTADQTVDLSSPDVNLTILSGSEATSLVVNTGSIDVVVPSGDTFTITSADRDLIVSGATTADVTQSCSSALLKRVAVSGGSGGETITLSASSSECTPSSSSGGGGGGGGGSSKPKTPVTPAAVPCAPGEMFSSVTGARCTVSNVVSCLAGQMFSPTTGERCNTFVSTTPSYTPSYEPSIPSASGYAFGNTLVKQGTKGGACKAWQMFLNDKANAGLATDGACGKLTMAAARAWQASMGLKADGLLGAMSRAKAMMQ